MANLFAERIAENGNTPDDVPYNLNLVEENPFDLPIYPNLSTGFVQIEHGALSDLKIEIYVNDGKLMLTNQLANTAIINLKPGIYTLMFLNDRGQILHERLIVL